MLEFNIQTLEGEEFKIKLSRDQVNKVFQSGFALNDLYGLDYLKLEISKKNGIDPIRQKLIADTELTIKTSLIPLTDTNIQLIILPPIKLNIGNNLCGKHYYSINIQMWYPLDNPTSSEIKSAMFSFNLCGCICYFNTSTGISDINVVGYDSVRDFLKIELGTISIKNLMEYSFHKNESRYNYKPSDPSFGWLKYDKSCMELSYHS